MKFQLKLATILLIAYSSTSHAILCPFFLSRMFNSSKIEKILQKIKSSIISEEVDPSTTDEIVQFLVAISYDRPGHLSNELLVENTLSHYREMGRRLFWANAREIRHLPIDMQSLKYDVHGMKALELVMQHFAVFNDDTHNRELADQALRDYSLLVKKFSKD